MNVSKAFLIALVSLLIPAGDATAQSSLEGNRVRIALTRPPEMSRYALRPELVGKVVAERSDSIFVQLHPTLSVLAIPTAEIRTLHISLGVPSRAKSALLGAGRMIIPGALYGGFVDTEFSDQFEERIAIGAAIGAFAGALTGALLPLERWRRIRR